MNMCFGEGVLQNVIGAFVGAFCGFGLAIVLQRSAERRNQKMQFRKVINAIDDELRAIYTELKEEKGEIVLDYKIQTPSWDSSLYSAMFLELIDSSKYNDYIGTYSLIKVINDCKGNKETEGKIQGLLQNLFESIEKLKILDNGHQNS